MELETTPVRRPIDAGMARSWLLVNAARAELFDPAQASEADQIVLDVEDAVDPVLKPAARDAVAAWLQHNSAWVRINSCETPFWSDDVDRLRGAPGLAGVMLAKAESAQQITDTFDRLGGATPVMALVESALGIEEASSIARARGAFRLAFGSGDYRRDTGTSADPIAMAYPRSRLVVASRIGNLPGPIDGPTVGDLGSILREQSTMSVGLGLTGKLCLDTAQAPVVNETMSPTFSDVEWANEFLADFAARGSVIRDGSDPPRISLARKITQLATAFAVLQTSGAPAV